MSLVCFLRYTPVFMPPHLLLLPAPPPPGLGSPLGVSGIPFLSLVALSYFGAYRPSCCLSRCRCSSLGCVCSPHPCAPHRDSPDLELTGRRVRVVFKGDANTTRNLNQQFLTDFNLTLISCCCVWHYCTLPVGGLQWEVEWTSNAILSFKREKNK